MSPFAASLVACAAAAVASDAAPGSSTERIAQGVHACAIFEILKELFNGKETDQAAG